MPKSSTIQVQLSAFFRAIDKDRDGVVRLSDIDKELLPVGIHFDHHKNHHHFPPEPDEVTAEEFTNILSAKVGEDPVLRETLMDFLEEYVDLFDADGGARSVNGVDGSKGDASQEEEDTLPAELFHITIGGSEEQEEEDLRQAFRIFDRDGNGYITAAELGHVMKTLGEHLSQREIDDMVDEADMDGDGEISFEDFSALMKDMLSEGS